MSRPLPGVRLGCSEPIWTLHKTVTPQAQYKGFPQAVGERLECWAATLWAWAHKDRQAIDCPTSPPGAKPQTQAVSVDHADRAADTVHFAQGQWWVGTPCSWRSRQRLLGAGRTQVQPQALPGWTHTGSMRPRMKHPEAPRQGYSETSMTMLQLLWPCRRCSADGLG